MAQEEGNLSHGALFPPPPPFFKHFTSENIDKLKQLQRAKGFVNSGTAIPDRQEDLRALQSLEVPNDLRFLVPPKPTHEEFRGFGIEQNITNPTVAIEEPGFERLYPETPPKSPASDVRDTTEWTLDRAYHLKRMVRSILLNFLDLLGILAVNPQEWADKVHDLHLLIVNSHKLINDYRPHQARETLIMMMEDQLEQKKAEVENIIRMKEKIAEMRSAFEKDGVITSADEAIQEGQLEAADLQRVWRDEGGFGSVEAEFAG